MDTAGGAGDETAEEVEGDGCREGEGGGEAAAADKCTEKAEG